MEKMIPAFMEQKLDRKKLETFIEHIETCQSCREELTIQFLVTEGMVRLEEGSAFDLQKELNVRMDEAGHEIRKHKLLIYLGLTLEMIAMVAIGIIIFLLLI